MLWQDWIFSIGSWIFVIALIPTILGKDKPALFTSLLNTMVLGIFAYAYFTLHLWLSSLSTVLTASCWFILAFQKYRQNKKK